MADKAISGLTAATSLASADLLVIENASGNSRKITAQNAGLVFRGALVKKAADQTTADYTAGAVVAWTGETYDTDTIHDNVTNNSRLTVPTGVTKVRLSCCISLASLTADLWVSVSIRKNGSGSFDGSPGTVTESGLGSPRANVVSPVLEVSATDYFEVFLQVETDNSITVTAATSWFAMEIVG